MFVVRLKHGSLFLGLEQSSVTPGYFYADSGLKYAQKFETKDAALAAIGVRVTKYPGTETGKWEILEVTHGLRWYVNGKPDTGPSYLKNFYSDGTHVWTPARKNAKRFATAGAAKAARHDNHHHRWGDHARVVRFSRKVA